MSTKGRGASLPAFFVTRRGSAFTGQQPFDYRFHVTFQAGHRVRRLGVHHYQACAAGGDGIGEGLGWLAMVQDQGDVLALQLLGESLDIGLGQPSSAWISTSSGSRLSPASR